MTTEGFFPRWHLIDQGSLSNMQQFTTSPGIHQLGTTALPAQIQQMPGAVSYLVSQYSAPIPLGSNTVAGGEFVVVRTDGETHKAYNYIFASSADQRVYFNGPFKSFPNHHFSSTSEVALESLFGHTPKSTSGSL